MDHSRNTDDPSSNMVGSIRYFDTVYVVIRSWVCGVLSLGVAALSVLRFDQCLTFFRPGFVRFPSFGC